MASPRTVLTTLVMLFFTGLIVAMMAVLWMVGQDLLQLKDARAGLSLKLKQAESRSRDIWDELQQAKADRKGLGQELKKATEAIEALKTEATATQARLKALEEAPRRLDVTPPQAAPPAPAPPAPPIGPAGHPAELAPAERDDPLPLPRAAARALQEKGIAGFCAAIGLDEAAQARFLKAHEEFLPQLLAADKAHAKVAIEGDAVIISIEPYHNEGHALLTAWQNTLAKALTPAQRKLYSDARGDVALFLRPFGHYTQTITLTRDAMGLKFVHRGTRVGGAGPTFESAGTIAGEGAVDRLPWRPLLPDPAVAKLRGGAVEP